MEAAPLRFKAHYGNECRYFKTTELDYDQLTKQVSVTSSILVR